MITIKELIKSGYDQLKHIESSHLDSEVLLSYVLNNPREYILAHGEDEVSSDKVSQFKTLIAERAKHKPVAYLTRHKEFYGRDFYVDERVHIPHPATEDLIDVIKRTIPADFSGTIADIGTGSGCIAVTLALEFPKAKITATDISNDALEVAKKNAANFNAKINFFHGDLLSALPEPVDIIISNPPYGWSDGWSDDKETKQQPRISYESGLDGLDAIRRIIENLAQHLNKGGPPASQVRALRAGRAFIEFDPRQSETIKKIAAAMGLECETIKDLSGFDRIAHLWYK